MSKHLVLPLLLIACTFALPLRGADPVHRVTHLDQGWSDAERNRFYTPPQGALLIPYTWFLHLEQASNEKPFRASDRIDRFRYLIGTVDRKDNPDGLPVRFTKEPTRKRDPKLLHPFMGRLAIEADAPVADDWLGLNCAACHTGQIEANGKRLRVDGAPAFADFNRFIRARSQPVEEKSKFDRFAAGVLGRARSADRAALRRRRAAYRNRNGPPFAPGYGRVDALGLIMNEVLGGTLGIPANYLTPDAPVGYLDLWLAPNLDWVQWNGPVANPFGRNVGEVLGAFGHVDAGALTPTGLPSSVRGSKLYELERVIDKLAPPKWDEAVLGKLDPEKVTRGADVYATANCAECHTDKAPDPLTAPNRSKRQFIKTRMVGLKDIGTDPKAATNFATCEELRGAFGHAADMRENVPAPTLLSQFVSQTALRQFVELKLTPAQQAAYRGYRTDTAHRTSWRTSPSRSRGACLPRTCTTGPSPTCTNCSSSRPSG